jgi:translocator protein
MMSSRSGLASTVGKARGKRFRSDLSGTTFFGLNERIRAFLNSDPNGWGSYPGSSAPVSPVLALVGFVGLCLLVGAVGGTIVAGTSWSWFLSLIHPPGMVPPGFFAPIWVCLYSMIGVAGWLAWRRSISARPLRLWGWQIAVNAFWAPAFFALHSPLLALAVSVVLLALVAVTVRMFAVLHSLAAWLLVPYLAWTGYVTYLTAGFWWLNAN